MIEECLNSTTKVKLIACCDGSTIIEKIEEIFPFSGRNAVVGSWNGVEVPIERSEKKADMVYKRCSPKKDTDDFLKVFSARSLKYGVDKRIDFLLL